MTVAAVILAASQASALADAAGTPAARRLADVAWAGGATPVVVCSFDPDGEVAAALANAEVTLADPAPREAGPVGQIVNGIEAAMRLVTDTQAALVWPARLAWVDAETVTTLIATHGEDRATVVQPAYRGEPGFPVLLPVAHLDAFRGLAADRMPGDLFADLAALGIPFRVVDTGDPGVVHRCLRGPRGPAPVRRAARTGRHPGVGIGRRRPAGRRARRRPQPPGAHPVRRPRRRTVGIALLVVLAVAVVGWLWYTQPQPVLPEATASLASTPEVTFVDNDGRLEWAPADGDYSTGLVIYPGGKVPPEAYGPLAQQIAAEGYLVAITPMPFNLAVFGIGAADAAIAAHPEVATWAMAGHSLGGSMAAQYTSDHLDTIEGLAFWASYPATDLSAAPIAVTSIYGTEDPGAARMSGPEARAQLPPDTVFVPIEGGNHEQMGYYTGQPNDGVATISREEQQAQVAAATVDMLERIAPPAP